MVGLEAGDWAAGVTEEVGTAAAAREAVVVGDSAEEAKEVVATGQEVRCRICT